MRKAFTLIEMLIVISIILVLLGLVAPKLLGALRSSREATCRMNLKNLQSAAHTHAVDNAGSMPRAGSFELQDHRGWHEFRGWIAWLPKSGTAYPRRPSTKAERDNMRDADYIGRDAMRGITNGTLFAYMQGEVSAYACPVAVHDKIFRSKVGATKSSDRVYLTYAMNEFFYHETRKNWHRRKISWVGTKETISITEEGITKTVIPNASRLVLFAEHSGVPWTTRDVIGKNCVLNVEDKDRTTAVTDLAGNKVPGIGGYHSGPIKLLDNKKQEIPWSLVVFTDGHIEKIFRNVRTEDSIAKGTKNVGWLLVRGRDLPDKVED